MRHRSGSVVQDKRSKTWFFYWWENGKRKSKALGRFPSKAKAWAAAKLLRDALETETSNSPGAPTVSTSSRAVHGGEDTGAPQHKADVLAMAHTLHCPEVGTL